MFFIEQGKEYKGRWFVRLLQATLILGIVVYGLDYFGQLSEPQEDTVVIESTQDDVRVITIEAQPNQPQYDEYQYFNFGLDHQMAGDYYEAIEDYTRSLELNEDIAPSYLNRGVAYEQIGGNDYNAMINFQAWMTRDDMTVFTRVPLSNTIDLTASMSANYRYDVPLKLNDGDVISLSAVSLNEDQVDPIIVLVDQTGRPVASNDDVRRGDGSLVSMNSYIGQYEVTRQGIYTLMVSHAGGGSYGDVVIRIDIDR